MPCQGTNDGQEDDRQSRHRHSGLHSLMPADDSDRHNIQDPKTNLPASPEIIDRDAYHQNERGQQFLSNNALSSSIHNAETESGPPVFKIPCRALATTTKRQIRLRKYTPNAPKLSVCQRTGARCFALYGAGRRRPAFKGCAPTRIALDFFSAPKTSWCE